MTLFQDNLSPYLTAVEQGSTPANPVSGNQKLFIRTSDHALCYLNSSGTVTPLASQAYANPMTTQDDIIVGGSSGVPGRLAKGTDGQVLTVDPSTHHLLWATPSAGFTNPMTTKGDVILGDTSGTPTRLGAGTSAYVLTSNGAAAFPSWQAAAGGGGPVAVSYADVTGGSTNYTSGDAIALTFTPAAGTYLFQIYVRLQRTSGSGGQWVIKLDTVEVWPNVTSGSWGGANAPISNDGVTYQLFTQYIHTLTNASHTLAVSEPTPSFLLYDRCITAWKIA